MVDALLSGVLRAHHQVLHMVHARVLEPAGSGVSVDLWQRVLQIEINAEVVVKDKGLSRAGGLGCLGSRT